MTFVAAAGCLSSMLQMQAACALALSIVENQFFGRPEPHN